MMRERGVTVIMMHHNGLQLQGVGGSRGAVPAGPGSPAERELVGAAAGDMLLPPAAARVT